MSKAARGQKRVCQSCGAKFYDLNHEPIVCPLCSAEYKLSKPALHVEAKAEAAAEKAAAAVKTPKTVDPVVADIDLELDPELAGVDEEDLADLDDVETPDTGDDDDDAFLPDEDESEDDVTGFIGESIRKEDDDI